jgi:hypothetical protein
VSFGLVTSCGVIVNPSVDSPATPLTFPARDAGTSAAVVLASTVRPAIPNAAMVVWNADSACATVASAVTCSRLLLTATFRMPAEVR